MRITRTPARLENVDYRAGRTYFVTFCAKGRHRAFADELVASIACHWIRHFCEKGWYWLYGYAVMPEHVHLVLRVRDRGMHLSRIVGMIKSAITCEVRRVDRCLMWQRGYHERIVRAHEDCEALVQYVLDNPVRRNLVAPGEQYPFSGILQSWR